MSAGGQVRGGGPAGEGEPADPRRWPILVIVLAGVLMSVLDGSVVNIALPTITAAFRVDLPASQWTITAYLVTMTALLLFFGRLSERTGQAFLFTAGLAVFTLASAACGLSATLGQLVAFRVLQAVGGAMVFSISGAILIVAFPPRERGRAMGYLGSTVAVGSILGPILGGFLVDSLGWRSIFFLNLPIGAVLVACSLAVLRLPEHRRREQAATGPGMDWVGAASLAAALVALMLLLAGTASQGAARPAALAALFLLSTAVFVRWERRSPRPLLDLRLLADRRFARPVLVVLLYFVATFMVNVAGPFYFEQVMGFRPTQVGLIFLVVPTILVVASPVAGWLYDRHYRPYYGTIGMAVQAAAFLLLGLSAAHRNVGGMAAAFVVLGLGSALFLSPNNTEIMSALPRSQAAVASSVSSTARNLGMGLGVSLSSILLTLQVRLAGQAGAVASAGRALLSGAVGRVMLAAAAVSLAGFVVLLTAGRETPGGPRRPRS